MLRCAQSPRSDVPAKYASSLARPELKAEGFDISRASPLSLFEQPGIRVFSLSCWASVVVKTLLAHPLTRGLDIDDPRTTHLRRQIIQEKSFLRQIYQEWYRAIVAALPSGEGAVVELGAGAGFMSDFIPNLITSEIFYCPNIRVVLDGSRLPFELNLYAAL